MLGCNLALICRDQPFAIRLLRDAGNRRVAVNCRSALPRAFGQCLGKVSGLNIAVIGVLDCADDTVHIRQWPDVLDLVRRQEIDIDANGSRNTRIIMILVHPVFGCRQPDVSDLRHSGMQTSFGFQAGVQSHRILMQLPDGIAEIEERE